jgi:hypothetical protein
VANIQTVLTEENKRKEGKKGGRERGSGEGLRFELMFMGAKHSGIF